MIKEKELKRERRKGREK